MEGEESAAPFIYAIKDSLFEQLGGDPETRDKKSDTSGNGEVDLAEAKATSVDLALAAVERANRTKFFELVIPVVPFISHRSARDHLSPLRSGKIRFRVPCENRR